MKPALGLVAVVLVLGVAAFAAKVAGRPGAPGAEPQISQAVASEANAVAPASAENAPVEKVAAEAAAVPQADAGTAESGLDAAAAARATPELSDADIAKAMTLRKIGKADAPLKLTEFASLSCPHCAAFYKETFPKIKEEYIDTGKVEYTYVDFPLNAPALVAAAAALCMPEDSYFRYIDYLFKTQETWVFSEKIATILEQDGKLLGASGDRLQQCMNSANLKGAIAARFKKESEAYNIDSTPSFVFNADASTKFSGEMTYENFKKVIEIELAKKAKGAASK